MDQNTEDHVHFLLNSEFITNYINFPGFLVGLFIGSNPKDSEVASFFVVFVASHVVRQTSIGVQ